MKGRALILVSILVGRLGASADAPPASTSPDDHLGPEFRKACWTGDLQTAEHLLLQGAPLENRDSYGRTPLFMACHDDAAIVRLLLAHGARADVIDSDGDTTVGRACQYGDLTSAKMLLAAGADLGHVNHEGRTPLMMAAREGHEDVVEWLLSQHVDVNYHATNVPALYYAIDRNHYLVAETLLEGGAHIETIPGPFAGMEHPFGYAMLAAQTDDPAMIELVLSHGAKVDERDVWGRTPMIRASAAGKAHAVACLLGHGADVNAADEDGVTSLMFSARDIAVDETRLLVQHGAHLEARDQRGQTALLYAACFARDQQAEALVELGAAVNARDAQGITPLECAGDCGDGELVAYLRSKGATGNDVRIIEKPPAYPALTPAQSWALDVGAIYTQYCGENPHVLGYEGRLDGPEEAKNELKTGWNITDRKALLQLLDMLSTQGDRQKLKEWGSKFGAISDDDFNRLIREHSSGPTVDQARKATRSSYLKWKDRSGLAWDLCRRAHMIGWGYAAGYLTADESWPLLMENARQIQAAFTSWHEMADNFLDGREAGEGERNSRFEACAKLLLNHDDPNSPWNHAPWETAL